MRVRPAAAAIALATAVMVASGCAAQAQLDPEPSPTRQTAPQQTEAPAPTPTAFVPDCLTIISDQTVATLEAEGFVLIPEHEQKLRAEQRVETLFFDNGGVDCMWGIAGGGDSLVAFGYSTITPADAASAQAQLEADGYQRAEEGSDLVFSIDPATDVMGIGDVFLFTDGEWFHSTTREAIREMRANIP